MSTELQYFLLLILQAQHLEIVLLDIITGMGAIYRFKLTFNPDNTGISTGVTSAILHYGVGRTTYFNCAKQFVTQRLTLALKSSHQPQNVSRRIQV